MVGEPSRTMSLFALRARQIARQCEKSTCSTATSRRSSQTPNRPSRTCPWVQLMRSLREYRELDHKPKTISLQPKVACKGSSHVRSLVPANGMFARTSPRQSSNEDGKGSCAAYTAATVRDCVPRVRPTSDDVVVKVHGKRTARSAPCYYTKSTVTCTARSDAPRRATAQSP